MSSPAHLLHHSPDLPLQRGPQLGPAGEVAAAAEDDGLRAQVYSQVLNKCTMYMCTVYSVQSAGLSLTAQDIHRGGEQQRGGQLGPDLVLLLLPGREDFQLPHSDRVLRLRHLEPHQRPGRPDGALHRLVLPLHHLPGVQDHGEGPGHLLQDRRKRLVSYYINKVGMKIFVFIHNYNHSLPDFAFVRQSVH